MPKAPICVKSFALSRQGTSHLCNEDAKATFGNYVVVADGMGGNNAGDVASSLAVGSLAYLAKSDIDAREDGAVFDALEEAISRCDNAIQKHADDKPETLGMGSTVVIALFVGMKVYVCWCGDSRCFVYSPKTGKIKFTTIDHSYVQDLVNNGEISAAEAFTHPDSNIITRFVGWGKDYAIPECAVCNIDEDDIVILCSDGLTGYSTTEDIIDTITAAGNNPDVITKSLVQLALDRGSVDDITVVTCVPCMQPKWFERLPFRLFIKS